MLEFAKSVVVPAELYEYFNNESLKSLQAMVAYETIPHGRESTSICQSKGVTHPGWSCAKPL